MASSALLKNTVFQNLLRNKHKYIRHRLFLQLVTMIMAFIEIFCRLLTDLIKNPQKLLSSIIQNKNSRRTRRVKLYYLRILIFDFWLLYLKSCVNWKALGVVGSSKSCRQEKMRYTILAFLIVSLCNTEGDSEPLVNFVSDIQRIREIALDFYEQIQTPVDRLQNLFREKFAPTLCKFIYNQPALPYNLRLIMLFIISGCGIRNS